MRVYVLEMIESYDGFTSTTGHEVYESEQALKIELNHYIKNYGHAGFIKPTIVEENEEEGYYFYIQDEENYIKIYYWVVDIIKGTEPKYTKYRHSL